MLIRFEVSNFRSVSGADPVELSLVAIDDDRSASRWQDALGLSLLPVVAIYGPNASGKSNVLAALAWLRDAVTTSLRYWDDEIPIDPFAFSSHQDSSSVFEIEMMVDGVRFEYILELSSSHVSYEGLFHYPNKKRRRVFEREGLNLTLQRGVGTISGTRELLTDRTVALAVAKRFDEPLVSRFAEQIGKLRSFGSVHPSRYRRRFGVPGRYFGLNQTMSLFDDERQFSLFDDLEDPNRGRLGDGRDAALAMLRLADLGIDDVLVENEEIISPNNDRREVRRSVRLAHRVGSSSEYLDFHDESDGTQMWFRLIGPVVRALNSGSVVIFDELDASLHPTLSAQLIRLFHDPGTNPLGSQIIFSSHDTSLLNHLNRDEVWLTEKRKDGSTRLGALSDFAGERVRRSRNLESAYLHGRFGALPDIDQTDFLRALGLIG